MKVRIAIVGSGPAGLSAGAYAAELGVSHVVLERSSVHANTIQEYQQGKLVMAEPHYLPLRSRIPFQEGSREAVLAAWSQALDQYGVNIRYNTEVLQITKLGPAFTLKLGGGDLIQSESVILSIGVAGNPRKLESLGAELPFVQYTLRDPEEYRDKTVVVVGAGDAAIENALALARLNRVCLVNRSSEFARAKQGNLDAVLKAIEEKRIKCYYRSIVARVESTHGGDKPCLLVLNTDENDEIRIPCDRIIARIGAVPPRQFVESCGVIFPSADINALPELSSKYESTVPGLYIIGALAGYPLIKQALNQGYEVIEHILGRDIKPADHELLAKGLAALPYRMTVEDCLALLQQRIPLFSQINPLLFREMMLESKIRVLNPGEAAFRKGDYSTSVFTILDGEIALDYEDGFRPHKVRSGEIFGELSFISGGQRTNTAIARSYNILVETPRRTFLKLAASSDSVREGLDQQLIARTIQNVLTPAIDIEELRQIARRAQLNVHRSGALIFQEKEPGEEIHLVRRGAVVLSRNVSGQEVLLRQVRAGEYFGEVSLMNVGRRTETARAVVATETIRLSREAFLQLLDKDATLLRRFQGKLSERAAEDTGIASSQVASEALRFLLKNGAGEATDLLVIDDSLCVGCDNCEIACAETHAGISRVNRKEGPSFGTIHIAVACRHCENPACMKECPPDAIRLEPGGQVNIDYNLCIACGKCESNCPYDVIRMAVEKPKRSHLFTWMLTGFGAPPGELPGSKEGGAKKAVKCDLCKERVAGPACVIACPTGAARRVKADQFNQLAREARP